MHNIELVYPGKPYRRERISTLDLVELASSVCASYLIEEVQRTDPSKSVRLPWFILQKRPRKFTQKCFVERASVDACTINLYTRVIN